MSNSDDQRFMRASPDNGEGTGLIDQSRSKLAIVSISDQPISMACRPISDKRTANFNLNISDHLLKFIWLLTI